MIPYYRSLNNEESKEHKDVYVLIEEVRNDEEGLKECSVIGVFSTREKANYVCKKFNDLDRVRPWGDSHYCRFLKYRIDEPIDMLINNEINTL